MDWSRIDMSRLYELYKQNFAELRADVIRANRSLGSKRPEKTWMELLSRSDFERLVRRSTDEPEVVHRWLLTIISGHEEEFPELRVAC